MKASELIEVLNQAVDQHGDRDIWIGDRNGFGIPVIWANEEWAWISKGDLVLEAKE